jgi:hypothetical protein
MTMSAVALPGGALLVIPGRPDAGDVAAIRAAAGPLLDLLAERGLRGTLLHPRVSNDNDF